MIDDYEVVIVGAGPAGLECARMLKDAPHSVLIIDKGKQIGPKTCAGGIVRTVEPLDLPASKARIFKTINVYLRGRCTRFRTGTGIKVIDRGELGRHQLNLLKGASNVTVRTETIVRKIEKGLVITDKGDFGYRYLVGADGSNSIVRRFLNLESRYMVGIYYDVKEIREHLNFYLDGAHLKTGYLWEFPHQHFTNIGFYFNPRQWKTRAALGILRSHMNRRGFAIDGSTYRAFPINYCYRGWQFGEDLFLTGDAAGLASKLTGEGIAYAIISGREIARRIMRPGGKLQSLEALIAFKKRQDSLVSVFEKIPAGLNIVYRLLLRAVHQRLVTWPG